VDFVGQYIVYGSVSHCSVPGYCWTFTIYSNLCCLYARLCMLIACVCFLLYLSFVYAAIEINFSMNKVDYRWYKVGIIRFRVTRCMVRRQWQWAQAYHCGSRPELVRLWR